jgi:hypothetical protein
MMSGLGAMNSRFKESQLAAKNATTQFGRMKGSLLAMGASATLTSGALLGMLMNAIMQSPFLAAAFEKLKVQMMLFGNAIARHLAPILEKVVDFIKWLRERFQDLPEPIQAGIVKLAAFGIIALGLISTLGFLGFIIGVIKSGLLLLIPAGLITKLGALISAIIGSSAVMFGLSVAAGLVAGVLGVIVLDKLGVLSWFENLGQRVGNLNGVLRDTLILMGTIFGGGLGQGIIDISRGDFDLPTFSQGREQAKSAFGRLKSGTSGQYGYGETSPTFTDQKQTQIESQSNTFNVDMSGVSGDMNDPRTIDALNTMFNRWLVTNQENINP